MKRFFCRTSIKNLSLLSQYKIFKLRKEDEKLSFYVDKDTLLELLNLIEIDYKDLYSVKKDRIIKKYLITIIGIILFSLILINQSKTITRVEFINKDTYNDEVIEFLGKYYKSIGPFNYLNADLTTINFELKSEFYHYEWIAVNKQGTFLYIDIKKMDSLPGEEDKRPGSIYASHSGVVKRYHIAKGIVKVQEEVYVNKGDLLISGLITNIDNSTYNVRASGYIIAEVLEYYDYTVLKDQTTKLLSGRMKIYKEFSIFSKSLSKSTCDYESCVAVEGKKTGIFGIFNVKKYYFYEEIIVKSTYLEEDAINYAKSMVRNDFKKTKVNEFEQIIFNNLVRVREDDNYFYIKLLVKSYRNIAIFVPREVEIQ